MNTNNNTQKSIIPRYISDSTLDKYRGGFYANLSAQNASKRNLADDRQTISQWAKFYEDGGKLPFSKKQKKQKIGKIGMNELTRIVLDLNQDVRQIKEAQSLVGAQNWVKKHGPDLYEVVNDDINQDGIPDVIVKNKNGENVIVNGYTTTLSTYPYRNAYYTTFPTQKERKEARLSGETYRNYITGLYNPQYDSFGLRLQLDQNGNPRWASQNGVDLERRLKNSGYEKIIRPSNRTPYQAFVAKVIKPIYDVIKFMNGGKANSELLSKVASAIWNQTILIPAMVFVYGNDVAQVSPNEWKKLRNKKEVKRAIALTVKPFLVNEQRIFDFVEVFVATCNGLGYNIPQNVVPWIPKFLKAKFLNVNPPALNETEKWQSIENEYARRVQDELQRAAANATNNNEENNEDDEFIIEENSD